MNKQNFWKIYCAVLAVVLAAVIVFGFAMHKYQESNGYHIVWSNANLRWVYVDKDGRP